MTASSSHSSPPCSSKGLGNSERMEVTFQRRWGSSGSGKEQAGEMPREAPRAGDTAGATQQPSVSCIPRQLGPAAPYIPIHSAPWHPAAPCIPRQLGPAAPGSTLHPDTAGSRSIPQHPVSRYSSAPWHPAAPLIPQHPSSRSTPHKRGRGERLSRAPTAKHLSLALPSPAAPAPLPAAFAS